MRRGTLNHRHSLLIETSNPSALSPWRIVSIISRPRPTGTAALFSHAVQASARRTLPEDPSELDDAQIQLEDDDLPAAERAAALRVVKLIDDPDYDWSDWVRAGGRDGLPEFLRVVDAWLADSVDWQANELELPFRFETTEG